MSSNADTTASTDVAFVVLAHTDRRGLHYDLMIDTGVELTTWKGPRPPEEASRTPIELRRIGGHRRQYLDYEGPISGDRGAVVRYDRGWCELRVEDDNCWEIRFWGERLNGAFRLERIRAGDQWWRLSFSNVC